MGRKRRKYRTPNIRRMGNIMPREPDGAV